MRNARRISLMATVALLAAAAAAAQAAEPAEIVKYRQAVMKANGAHMSAAAAIIFGKVDFKSDLGEHVRALQAINRDIPALFPAGSTTADSAALPGVWMSHDDFKKRAADAARRAEALAKAVAAGDTKSYAARFGELGDACKACHKDYRMNPK
jgi:cytochrome c556